MKIQHDQYGEVEDVKESPLSFHYNDYTTTYPGWKKDGRYYLVKDGWRAVTEPRWVEWTRELAVTHEGLLLFPYPKTPVCLGDDYRFKKVDRYALPDNFLVQLGRHPMTGLQDFVDQFRMSCLIIERKEEG